MHFAALRCARRPSSCVTAISTQALFTPAFISAGHVRAFFARAARAARFWAAVLRIWAAYKRAQVKAALARTNAAKRCIWDKRHAAAAESMWRICVDMRGFYVKAGQLIALQAFVPRVIREKLSRLQDDMPAMTRSQAASVLERELGPHRTISQVFESLDLDAPIGSASIAQVHRGRLRASNLQVAVKLQYPGGESMMMNDLGNFRFLAHLLQRTELKFDLVGPVRELSRQIGMEFDFEAEAQAMTEIGCTLKHMRQVQIPRPIPNLVTRRMLVMSYLHGMPMTKLGETVRKRGGKRAIRRIGRKVLTRLADVYGEMILKNGFFQADCHPGNVLVTNANIDIGLLDFGQTKRLRKKDRLAFARLVEAIAQRNAGDVQVAMSKLGIDVHSKSVSTSRRAKPSSRRNRKTAQVSSEEALSSVSSIEEPQKMPSTATSSLTAAEKLAYTMFDTANVAGVSNNPFSDQSALRTASIDHLPQDLFFLLRTVQILKGICTATYNPDFSIAVAWAPIARQALRAAASQ